MKVAIVGATGFVGSAVLNELLQKGHQVTAIVLDPDKLESRNGLSVVKGDINDAEDFADKIAGNDAVISAFNAGWTNPNLYADFLHGSGAIQTGVKNAGIKRLLVAGGAGSLYIGDQQLVDSPEFPAEWRTGASAARDYLNILKEETELDWVFIRKGVYRTGGDNPVFDMDGRSVISVEDLAVAIVDELEDQKHSRQRFTVAY
jgi:putative NADH-flavin reductase